MKNFFVIAVLALGLTACGSNNSENEGPSEAEQMEMEAYQEVMETHDAIMPEMGALREYASKLESMKAELPEEKQATVDQTIAILNQAQESMMTWMQSLSSADPSQAGEDKSHEEIMAMIQEQKQNAEAVRELFTNAKEKAESVMQDLMQPAEQ